MDDTCTRAAEQATLALRRAGARTIAFTAPEPGSEASAFAALTATVLARSGQPTLLINLSQTVLDSFGGPVWVPGQGEAKSAAADGEAGFARLKVRTGPAVQFLFDNREWFRSVLDADLASYDYIVLDLASLFDRPEGAVNPLAVAAACDAMVLVCERGRVTRQMLRNAADMARVAGCRPFGIVMTQGDYVSPGEEIARGAKKLFFFLPRLAKRIARKAMMSEILG